MRRIAIVGTVFCLLAPVAIPGQESPQGYESVEALITEPGPKGDWERVREGVWQRRDPDGSLEHYATGSEGIRWALEGMRQQLRELEDRADRGGDGVTWERVNEYRSYIAAIEQAHEALDIAAATPSAAVQSPTWAVSAIATPSPRASSAPTSERSSSHAPTTTAGTARCRSPAPMGRR